MKKWMKGLLITGVVLFLAGTAVTAFAAVAGGLKSGNELAGRWLGEHVGRDTLEYISDLILISHDEGGRASNMEEIEDVPKTDLVLAGSIADVEQLKKLELEAERVAVRFEERDDESGGILVYVREDPRMRTDLEWDSRDGKAEIRLTYPKILRRYGEAVIEVPAGYRFGELELEVKAGYMKIRNVRAYELKLAAKAAELSVERFEAEKMEVDVKAGRLTAAGDAKRLLEVETAAGSAEISLDGRRSQYGYEIKNAVGNVEIGESRYTGLSYDLADAAGEWEEEYSETAGEQAGRGGDSRKKRLITVDCSAGSVQVTFAGEPD